MHMERNQAVFDQHDVARELERDFIRGGKFLDRGEQQALLFVAARVRGMRILDVGAGVGRLAPLLRLLSDDYIAIDYAPNMVDTFRRNLPGFDVSIGDARDLSRFADGSIGLIIFSNNGLDSASRDDRFLVMREFQRVISERGWIVFSTLNLHGVSYGESPFQLRRRGEPTIPAARAWARSAFDRVTRPMSWPRSVGNWRRLQRVAEDHCTWAIGPLAAHDFAPLVHFATLTDVRDMVRASGLTIERIFADDGTVIDATAADSTADYFTVVARR